MDGQTGNRPRGGDRRLPFAFSRCGIILRYYFDHHGSPPILPPSPDRDRHREKGKMNYYRFRFKHFTYEIFHRPGLWMSEEKWSCLYTLLRAGLKSIYITSLTHSPKIFGAVAEAYEDVFPNGSQGAEPESFHRTIRDMLMASYLKEFNMRTRPKIDERFVIRGFRQIADGTILIPDTADTVPRHRKAADIEPRTPGKRGFLRCGQLHRTGPFA